MTVMMIYSRNDIVLRLADYNDDLMYHFFASWYAFFLNMFGCF